VALGVGLVVAEDADDALEAADPRRGDRGGAAARACLEMIALRSRFLGPAR